MRELPRVELGSRTAGLPPSAIAYLGPTQACLDFVAGLERGQAVLEEVKAIKHLRISLDVDQDSSQPASFRNVEDVVRRLQRIEFLAESRAEVLGGHNLSHWLTIRQTVGFANVLGRGVARCTRRPMPLCDQQVVGHPPLRVVDAPPD